MGQRVVSGFPGRMIIGVNGSTAPTVLSASSSSSSYYRHRGLSCLKKKPDCSEPLLGIASVDRITCTRVLMPILKAS